MSTLNPIILLCVGGLFGLLVYAAISGTRGVLRKRDRGYRLERIDSISSVEEMEALLGEDLMHPEQKGLLSILPVANDRYVRRSDVQGSSDLYGDGIYAKFIKVFNNRLDRAHNALVPWEYLLLMALGGIGGLSVGWFVLPNIWFASVMAITGAVSVSETMLRKKARNYVETVNKQAIALTQLVIQGLRSGYTVGNSFEFATMDLGDPIARELAPLLAAHKGQVPFDEVCRKAIPNTSSNFLKKIYKVIIMCILSDFDAAKMAERLLLTRRNLLVEYALKMSMKAEAGGGMMAKNFLTFIVPALLLFLIKQSPILLMPLIQSPLGWFFVFCGFGFYFGGIYASGKTLKALEV